jgi:hypothetical protein
MVPRRRGEGQRSLEVSIYSDSLSSKLKNPRPAPKKTILQQGFLKSHFDLQAFKKVSDEDSSYIGDPSDLGSGYEGD